MRFGLHLLCALCAVSTLSAAAGVDPKAFSLLDLGRPGLEQTARLWAQRDTLAAARALLDYYKGRNFVTHPDLDPRNVTITEEEQKWADDGMKHVFFVHYGYQPSFFYGEDIDWMYWPVKDNELRWQLHRTKWWVPMGKAYRVSGDEKYAAEWMRQYIDWIEKNPLIEFDLDRAEASSGELDYRREQSREQALAQNSLFAWRPLEVSDRLEHQIRQFALLVTSESMTPEFLTRFLVHYHRQAEYITRHFSAAGNHLLFEAQRLTYAGVFFPEYKDAPLWRAEGVGILNAEIQRQVYDDGMQYELDPHYHMAAINIFFNALRMMDANCYRDEFPASYLACVESMIVLYYNICFPDYTNPMFSDAKLHDKAYTLPFYPAWSKVFPDDKMIAWLAGGMQGPAPEQQLSRAFKTSGFYTMRDGWGPDATVMVLKAGPKGEWHAQPDNGTFELWRKGRNFFPDSGSYIYGGDQQIMDLRNWFRQTQVHNTLTLDGRNLEQSQSERLYWSAGEERGKGSAAPTDILSVATPGYEGLTHRRTLFFVDRQFFVIVDEAYGQAAGQVELNYHLLECDPVTDREANLVRTAFPDGNNISLQVFSDSRLQMDTLQGWVSRAYRERNERPWIRFATAKPAAAPVRFITVIRPAGQDEEKITARFKGAFSADKLEVELRTGGKNRRLRVDFK